MRTSFLLLILIFSALYAKELSLEEKVGQLFVTYFEGESITPEVKQFIEKIHLGGIIYYTSTNPLDQPSKIKALSEALQSTSKIPLFIAIDQEGGKISPLEGYPGNHALKTSRSAYLLSHLMGRELKTLGVNLNFAPVVDVNSNPKNPVIGTRAYHHTPEIVTEFGGEALRGFLEAGITPCCKHFPGHGETRVDSHLALPVVDKKVAALERVEFYPFRHLLTQTPMIMSAHVLYPSLDPDNCATLSKRILTHLLRDLWGYQGILITDSLTMLGVSRTCESQAEVALRAFEAGNDLLLIGNRFPHDPKPQEEHFRECREIYDAFLEAVKSGRISEKRLNASTDRILALKQAAHPPFQLSDREAESLAKKIWMNECGGKKEKLTSWHPNEPFPSLGIGHFIWPPEGYRGPFSDGKFPQMIAFLKQHGIKIPDSIQTHPWKTREAFLAAYDSIEMEKLRTFLAATATTQTLFIVEELYDAFAEMLHQSSQEKRAHLIEEFCRVAFEPNGLYILADYLNFKGTGLIQKQRYQGEGWGLLQVLENMRNDDMIASEAFVISAKEILKRRVEHAPNIHEKQWIPGWFSRLETYENSDETSL